MHVWLFFLAGHCFFTTCCGLSYQYLEPQEPLRVTVPNALCGLESFNRFLRNTSFRYTKPRLCVHWRSKSLSLQPGTDRFTTRSFDFLSFWIRETNCSVHGTDPFATQNANFLNLHFRNRLTGSTEPIDLPHRTLNSQIYFSGTSLTVSAEPIV